MDLSLKLFFNEFNRKLDELEARWERRSSLPMKEPRVAAEELRVGGLGQFGATSQVVADNWGGWFDEPVYVVEKRIYEQRPAAVDVMVDRRFAPSTKAPRVAAVVDDSWGGWFKEPVRAVEEWPAAVKRRDAATKQVFAAQFKAEVVPDNWGGLFKRPTHVEELALSAFYANLDIPGLASTGQICIDSASPPPMKEQSARTMEERSFDLSAEDAFTELASLVQICVSEFKVEYALPANPVDPTWSSLHLHESVARLLLHDTGKPKSILASDKEREVEEVVEEVLLSTGGEVLKAIVAESNVDQLLSERPHVSTLVRDSLAQRARQFNIILGGGDFVFVGMDTQRIHIDFAPIDPDLRRCAHLTFGLSAVQCVLCATPLDSYDGSLDDDPGSGFAHLYASLDGAIGRDGQTLAGAAALRTDAVGAAGGGQLACIMAAGSVQTSCSTVCPANSCCFNDILGYALWEEEMPHCGDNNYGLAPVSWMVWFGVQMVGSVPCVPSDKHELEVWIIQLLQQWPPPAVLLLRPTPWPSLGDCATMQILGASPVQASSSAGLGGMSRTAIVGFLSINSASGTPISYRVEFYIAASMVEVFVRGRCWSLPSTPCWIAEIHLVVSHHAHMCYGMRELAICSFDVAEQLSWRQERIIWPSYPEEVLLLFCIPHQKSAQWTSRSNVLSEIHAISLYGEVSSTRMMWLSSYSKLLCDQVSFVTQESQYRLVTEIAVWNMDHVWTVWELRSKSRQLKYGACTNHITFLSGRCRGYDLPDKSSFSLWDPGGSHLLDRLGGKPNFKKGGMSGLSVMGWHGRPVQAQDYSAWALQRKGRSSRLGH